MLSKMDHLTQFNASMGTIWATSVQLRLSDIWLSKQKVPLEVKYQKTQCTTCCVPLPNWSLSMFVFLLTQQETNKWRKQAVNSEKKVCKTRWIGPPSLLLKCWTALSLIKRIIKPQEVMWFTLQNKSINYVFRKRGVGGSGCSEKHKWKYLKIMEWHSSG